jgi:hypothetical protein
VVFWSKSALVDPNGPADRYLVLRYAFSAEQPATQVLAVEGRRWVRSGGPLIPRDPYGPEVMGGVADAGALVVGDGVEYCFLVGEPEAWQPRRICREWERRPGKLEAIRVPEGAELNAALRQLVETKHRYQEVGERKNSYHRLLVDHAGCAWVRVATHDQPYDNLVMGMVRELRPETFLWEVFRLKDGRPVGRYRVESWIEPRAVRDGVVIGTGEMVSGEVGVVRIARPEGYDCR